MRKESEKFMFMKDAVDLIEEERIRQVLEKKYTSSHDDLHTRGELAIAAAKLALNHTDATVVDPQYVHWKLTEKDTFRNLVKAGALIAAEIDRLQR